jgi:hypothetical protein
MKCTAQVTMNIVIQLTQPWDTTKATLNEVFEQAKREANRKVSQLLTAAGGEIVMRGEAVATAVFIGE